MPRFLSCLSDRSYEEQEPSASSLLIERKEGCPFCGDVSVANGFKVVSETTDLIAFRDRSPRYDTHILIIPRQHLVSTVKDLRQSHVPLLRNMGALADQLVPGPKKLGFHIPPFSSVHHLHLHVLAGRPTWIGRLKYPESRSSSGGKGLSWFVTLDQAISILSKGDSIGLTSSK